MPATGASTKIEYRCSMSASTSRLFETFHEDFPARDDRHRTIHMVRQTQETWVACRPSSLAILTRASPPLLHAGERALSCIPVNDTPCRYPSFSARLFLRIRCRVHELGLCSSNCGYVVLCLLLSSPFHGSCVFWTDNISGITNTWVAFLVAVEKCIFIKVSFNTSRKYWDIYFDETDEVNGKMILRNCYMELPDNNEYIITVDYKSTLYTHYS